MVSVRETLKRLFETAKAKGETGIRYSVFGVRYSVFGIRDPNTEYRTVECMKLYGCLLI